MNKKILLIALLSLLLSCSAGLAEYRPSDFPSLGQCGPGNSVGQGVQIKPVPPQALDVRGPEAVSEGSQYTAIGGDGSYAWSISCGEIDQTGKVGSISGCCGAGTVTVNDGAGDSDFLNVRLPSGGWAHNPAATECLFENCSTPYYYNTHVEISGGTKKESVVTVNCCLIEGEAGHTGTCPPAGDGVYYIPGISGVYCEGSYAPYGGMWFGYWGEKYVSWYTHNYFNWECPQ